MQHSSIYAQVKIPIGIYTQEECYKFTMPKDVEILEAVIGEAVKGKVYLYKHFDINYYYQSYIRYLSYHQLTNRV